MGETECFFGHNIARGGGEDDGMNPKPNKKLSLGAESYGTIAWKGFFTQSQVLLSSIVGVTLSLRWRKLNHLQADKIKDINYLYDCGTATLCLIMVVK